MPVASCFGPPVLASGEVQVLAGGGLSAVTEPTRLVWRRGRPARSGRLLGRALSLAPRLALLLLEQVLEVVGAAPLALLERALVLSEAGICGRHARLVRLVEHHAELRHVVLVLEVLPAIRTYKGISYCPL